MIEGGTYYPSAADILYGSYIRYDRLFEMTKFAFYGKTDSENVNIYIDIYSILKGLYTRGTNIKINDSYAIASCIINLAIHLRAYFDTRHRVASKIFIIYGGARPVSAISQYPTYNMKNIQMEESNQYLKQLIIDNLEVIKILCPYLFDIYAIVDYENEFSVITSALIDSESENGRTPNIVYSKDPMAYQLVAFKPRTFLYRPKKRNNMDCSWVVTKSTLYASYRYGELGLTKQFETCLDVKMFSIYQAIAGIKSRNIPSNKNGNATVKLLEAAVQSNVFSNGYNASGIMRDNTAFTQFCTSSNIDYHELMARFASIDLLYQTMIYKTTPSFIGAAAGIINLYNPQEVRNINDKYFQTYPLDLNRV
jgi:hypothetical protein